jgi:hypothetical protein
MAKHVFVKTVIKAKKIRPGDSIKMAGLLYKVEGVTTRVELGENVTHLLLELMGTKKPWHAIINVDAHALMTVWQKTKK